MLLGLCWVSTETLNNDVDLFLAQHNNTLISTVAESVGVSELTQVLIVPLCSEI